MQEGEEREGDKKKKRERVCDASKSEHFIHRASIKSDERLSLYHVYVNYIQ